MGGDLGELTLNPEQDLDFAIKPGQNLNSLQDVYRLDLIAHEETLTKVDIAFPTGYLAQKKPPPRRTLQ